MSWLDDSATWWIILALIGVAAVSRFVELRIFGAS